MKHWVFNTYIFIPCSHLEQWNIPASLLQKDKTAPTSVQRITINYILY